MWDTELFLKQPQDSKKRLCYPSLPWAKTQRDVFAAVIKDVTMNKNGCWGFKFSGSLLWLECFLKCAEGGALSLRTLTVHCNKVLDINPISGSAT